MILQKLFRPRPAAATGQGLYGQAVLRARDMALYRDMGVPDTPEGRFEMYSLHVGLLIERLKGQGDLAAEVSQSLFDAYIVGLDDAFREMGIGDLSVGKKMRKLGAAFYGRLHGYDAAVAALPDREPLCQFLGRTVWGSETYVATEPLAAYLLAQREQLAGQALESVLGQGFDWSGSKAS